MNIILDWEQSITLYNENAKIYMTKGSKKKEERKNEGRRKKKKKDVGERKKE